MDTGRNAIGRIKYNRYKLLTFVLAALVIANALGITGWTVNTITGLEINLPELAWAASPECYVADNAPDGSNPDCLDCQTCAGGKGDGECVDDCPNDKPYCVELWDCVECRDSGDCEDKKGCTVDHKCKYCSLDNECAGKGECGKGICDESWTWLPGVTSDCTVIADNSECSDYCGGVTYDYKCCECEATNTGGKPLTSLPISDINSKAWIECRWKVSDTCKGDDTCDENIYVTGVDWKMECPIHSSAASAGCHPSCE